MPQESLIKRIIRSYLKNVGLKLLKERKGILKLIVEALGKR